MPAQEQHVDSLAVAQLFRERFGAEPAIIASAPGRVNLIGEHTDYNGGEVLPIAIGRRTFVAVGRAPNRATSVAVSANMEEAGEWTSDSPRPVGRWWDYLSGIAARMPAFEIGLPPLRVAVASDVPAGAGLGSSAALEVAAAAAFSVLSGTPLVPIDAALLAHRVETEYVGVGCGIMDQFACALCTPAMALHLWCDSGRFEQVPMRDTIMIFDTGVPRALRDSVYNRRRRECEEALARVRSVNPALTNLAAASSRDLDAARLPEPLHSRARHVVEENGRVAKAAESLRHTGTIPGELLRESHESLRSLYDCSSAELDWVVERAAALPGIRGARLTGAGWGGCAIALGETDALAGAAASIAIDYQRRFRLTPRTWITRAEGGLRVEDIRR